MANTQQPTPEDIQPEMVVQTSEGALGEEDVSKPKVTKIVTNQQGQVKHLVIEKGLLFKKALMIPIERVQAVECSQDGQRRGKVVIQVGEAEVAALSALGPGAGAPDNQRGLLDLVEQAIPTAEGLRELEACHTPPQVLGATAQAGEVQGQAPLAGSTITKAVLGPGLLSGTSGNDPSAVTLYAVDGANVGYGHLWLMLLTTPLYYAIQFACAKIGRITGKGLAQLLREHYGPPLALVAALLLVISNIALIAADLAAVGSGFELITGLSWLWFVVPSAVALWYLTVYRTFEAFTKIFLTVSLVFVAYILTSFFTHANWGAVLVRTFVPQLGFDFTSISSAVALLGATISPYSMFWQATAEIEQQREGTLKRQVRTAMIDVGSGAIAGQMVAYFIIICTAATLFVHHQNINTAADAARSLEPLAGPLARYLFAFGLIGSGLVAIPVLLVSTSYAVAGAVGWPGALAKRPWQSEGFYLVLTAALMVGLVITLFGVNPIQLIFWSNIVTAIIAPGLVIAILLVGNHPTIMKQQRLSLLHNAGLVLITLILIAGAVLLFYQLATGQGS